MSKPERSMWSELQPLLKPYGHFERIENAFGSGMPDVNYCIDGHEGWIELKARTHWPVRPGTPVTLAHYTAEQRRWCRTRVRAGGTVWWLLKANTDLVLLRGQDAASLYTAEPPTKEEIIRYCHWLSPGKPDADKMADLSLALTARA